VTGIEVRWLRLDRLEWTDTELEACLAPAERARADRFHFPRDRQRFVRRRGALRYLLSDHLGAEPAAIDLTTGPNGRPELHPGPHPEDGRDLRFNQSSSGDTAVYAFATGIDVGIDVERHRDDIDIDALAFRFFSPREVAALEAESPGSPRSAAFFACWTMKEAFVKARGDGLSLPLDGFDVDFRPGGPTRTGPATGSATESASPSALLATRWNADEAARWCLRPLPAPAGCSAALAVAAPCGLVRLGPVEGAAPD
jgi:4'-phosphopantetheinyl transferase